MVVLRSSPFGNANRTRVLIALSLLTQSYARELSRLIETPLSGIQGALRTLERDGLVVGRMVGRTRVFEINPRYFARQELEQFLVRLREEEPELRSAVEGVRRRPRRTGKPL